MFNFKPTGMSEQEYSDAMREATIHFDNVLRNANESQEPPLTPEENIRREYLIRRGAEIA